MEIAIVVVAYGLIVFVVAVMFCIMWAAMGLRF